mgnify:CR=1 FL=1
MKIEGEMLMKKSIIALAVAGALVAPLAQADATLYGSLRVKATNYDNSELDIADNVSRVGIKGSSELFSGAKAIFQFEEAANTETGNRSGRLALIGATGDFGTVTMGRQWTPFYLWTATTDILDNGSSGASVEFGRVPNTLAYITPDMGGFQAAAVLVARDGAGVDLGDTGDDADAYNLAAHFSAGGFSVGLSTLMYQGAIDENYTSVAASYTMGDLYVAAEATSDSVSKKVDASINDDVDTFEVAGSYALGDVKLLANFVSFDKGEQVGLEAQYKLGAKSRVAATVVTADDDAPVSDSVAVSWRVDF